jgi:hypothetical protein
LTHRIGAILLLPAFVWLIYNYSVNWHLHYLDSGWTVTHAHPFDKNDAPVSNTPSHHHNGSQLLILDQVFQLLTLALVLICISEIFRRVVSHKSDEEIKKQILAFQHCIPPLRGPPSAC